MAIMMARGGYVDLELPAGDLCHNQPLPNKQVSTRLAYVVGGLHGLASCEFSKDTLQVLDKASRTG
jgi:hypothetical protein